MEVKGHGKNQDSHRARTDSEAATAALRFARRVHLGQHRKQTHEQFVEHPIEVARLLTHAGYGGEVIVAAYLHDVVEHTQVEPTRSGFASGPRPPMRSRPSARTRP